jgi:uncharacterized protein YjiS (DUF1127 family)
MTGNDESALGPCGNHRLTAEQWDHFKRSAREARTQAMRGLLGGVLRLLHELVARGRELIRTTGASVKVAAGNAWRFHAAWRKRRAAIRELRALDDRMLKDIGLGRSEIESVLSDSERLRARGHAIASLRPQVAASCARSQQRIKPAIGPLIDRSAA